MADPESSSTPIADKALARLRALAKGNGIEPEAIVLTASEEKVYDFEGISTLTPFFETKGQTYGGMVRGPKRQILPNFAALHADAKKRESEFKGRPDWIAAAAAELRKEPGEGWGLDGARIELSERSVILAASEACKTCQGSKTIPCSRCFARGHETCFQCHGQKQEFCYYCNYNNSGTGQNPPQPGQICALCSGRRYITCRTCHGAGQTACPMCQGRGGTPCAACKGMGHMTEEIQITCGATTHFTFKAEGLPSGLRRGLDRLGIANLTKGHADVTFVESKAPEDHESVEDEHEYIPGGLVGVAPPLKPSGSSAPPAAPAEDEENTGFGSPRSGEAKPSEPVLHYTARMPFADLRVDFNGKKVEIGVFGLRNVFIDVPPFLDDALAPWIEKLELATKGRGAVYAALEARALHEALALHLQGKGNAKEFRRLYPFGISKTMADKILRDTLRSIKRLTLPARAIAAIVSVGLGAGIFAECFFSPLATRLLQIPEWGKYILDFAPLTVAEILGWAVINVAMYFDLHRHFSNTKIGFRQTIGKTGAVTLMITVIIWLGALALSPVRPSWLAWLSTLVHK